MVYVQKRYRSKHKIDLRTIDPLALPKSTSYLSCMVVHIVHGINLGQLGTRQPEIYGSLRLEDQIPILQTWLDAHFGGTELR